MIQETCVEIGELEARWTSLREARNARRQKIRYIDELIDAFEKEGKVGTMMFLVDETRLTNQHGELVRITHRVSIYS